MAIISLMASSILGLIIALGGWLALDMSLPASFGVYLAVATGLGLTLIALAMRPPLQGTRLSVAG
ncbi:hypothetical protein [Sagittula salina]|uniref:Uncharacterized protein n=1 Tax=Sagittula salina TaxID=2820268 RepID=A0A940MSJ5_9RHOB|nr:hypothetical protein [Sagittula salina]MBP0483237.1 hypothetical protein [Sagittula salina]